LPGNTPGGKLKGAEVSFQMPFTFLPGFLKAFGTQMNYTYVDSDISYNTGVPGSPFVTERLTNLSNDAYNVTLYYDNGTFSARASLAYRGNYLTTVPGRNSQTVAPLPPYNNNVEGTASTTTIDASATYNLNDHVSVSLEGLNLTDEYDDQWIDSGADRSSYYHHSGRTVMLGARYKF
jgi:TonB-dependent receptor